MANKVLSDNIFYNIGLVKGKIEVLSDFNIKRDRNEVTQIIEDINIALNLIYKQACELSSNKKIEVPNLNNRYF